MSKHSIEENLRTVSLEIEKQSSVPKHSEDLDIRSALREKKFLLCECEKFSLGVCKCKGFLDFNDEMVAVLVDMFDFTRTIDCKESSWKENSPNEISLGLECTPLGSVAKSSLKGTLNLKAWRLVTLVKGKKRLAINIRANIEVKQMKYNKVFQLIDKEVMKKESRVENDDTETSSEDEVPSEDSDSEVWRRILGLEENVRTGSLEIEKQSSVPSDRSSGIKAKEWKDVNANYTSLVKNLSGSGETNQEKKNKMMKFPRKDDSKSKTKKIVVDRMERKKRRTEEASSVTKKLKTEDHAFCENETNGNGSAEKNENPREKKGTSSEDLKVDSNLVYQVNVINEESKSKSQKSDESEDKIERLRAELLEKEKELIDIKQKLLQEQLCRTDQKKGDGDGTEVNLRLNEGGAVSLIPNHNNRSEALDIEMASQKNDVIEISSDEETEYVEQDISDVEEHEKGHFLMSEKQSYTDQLENGNYNLVFIEIETILASNSCCKEITQIGGFKENTIGNSEARFFKAIVPKNLNHYLENYKLGGDLLQTLHMQKNDSGNFEFRNQFEVLNEDRVAIQCVSEEEALEALSSYLAAVENCIIVTLNEENVKLLVKQIKLLGITNKRIHMDTVKGFCTWLSYLREAGASKEDLNQEFEDWYDGHVKSSSSSENDQKHADVVAKMVHDSITDVGKFVPHQLLKASHPIKSLLPNQTPERGEPSNSEIQYLELFSSLRHDFPVRISLKKLETYDISSEDEGDARNGNKRNTGRGNLEEGQIDDVELHIDTSVEDIEEYFNDVTETSQDKQHMLNPSEGSVLKCQHCQKSFKTYGMKIAHVLQCNSRPAAKDILKIAHVLQCNSRPAAKDVLPKSVRKAKDSNSNVTVRSVTTSTSKSIPNVPRKRITFESLPSTPIKDLPPLNSVSSVPTPARVNSVNAVVKFAFNKCPICNKQFSSAVGRNEHIIAKHNPNKFDQLPILPLELQCQRCYRWFPKVPNSFHHCRTKRRALKDRAKSLITFLAYDGILRWRGENPKIPLFLLCQLCNRSFKTYEEKTGHTLKCNSKIATKGISANPVPNASVKAASLIETVKNITNQDAPSKTVKEADIVKSKDQSPNSSTLPFYPSREYVPGYNCHQADFGIQGFGRFPHPEAGYSHHQGDYGNQRLRRSPHPETGLVNEELTGFHHPPVYPVNGGCGRFPRPQAEPVNGGLGEFHHPQVENVMGGFGRFHHPQAGPVNGEFDYPHTTGPVNREFDHPQADPDNGGFGEIDYPQAGPDNGEFGELDYRHTTGPVNREFDHLQADPDNGGFGEFDYPQAGPDNGGFGEFDYPQVGPVNGELHNPQAGPDIVGFGELDYPQAGHDNREFHHPQAGPDNGEFHHPQAGHDNGEFHHPQAGLDNGGFGRFPHPQAEPDDVGFGEFQAENGIGGFGRVPHPQGNLVNGEFGEFHNPQIDPVNEEFRDLRWKLLKKKYFK